MRNARLGRSRLVIAVVTALVVTAAMGTVTVAFASHDNPSEIHGCVKKNGQVRIVSNPSSCNPSNETVLNWNAQGPAGPPGPPGGGGAVTGHEIVQATFSSDTDGVVIEPIPGQFFTAVEGDATCPAGKKVFGGSATHQFFFGGQGPFDFDAQFDRPSSATSWHAFASQGVAGPTWTLTVYAICANAA